MKLHKKISNGVEKKNQWVIQDIYSGRSRNFNILIKTKGSFPEAPRPFSEKGGGYGAGRHTKFPFGSLVEGGLTVLISVLIIFAVVQAGTITPPSGAGEPSAKFYTLSEIYTRLTTNATTTEGGHSFTFSDSATGTHYTLTQIYNVIPTIDGTKVFSGTNYLGVAGTLTLACATSTFDGTGNLVADTYDGDGNGANRWCMATSTNSAAASQILSGYKAWLNGIELTGSISTQTLSAATTTVSAGYYNATTVDAVDTDLAAGNVKSGITIFGILGNLVSWLFGDNDASKVLTTAASGGGTYNAADLSTSTVKSGTGFGVSLTGDYPSATYPLPGDTGAGDAAAGNILSGLEAWTKAGALLTGSISTQTLSAATTTVSAGYYNATTVDAVDTDLAAGNIKSGVNIFGVNGSVSPSYNYALQRYQVYDDYNCSGNNGEGTSTCAAGDAEYTGEEGTWTKTNTDGSVPTGMASGKVYQDARTLLYWSDYFTTATSNSFTINCTDAAINNGTCDYNSYAAKGNAITLCQNLSLDSTGGVQETDWRLPSQKELMQAYIDGAANNLPNPGNIFWSSTEYYNDSTGAWYVDLHYGDTYYDTKTNTYYVRCVRP